MRQIRSMKDMKNFRQKKSLSVITPQKKVEFRVARAFNKKRFFRRSFVDLTAFLSFHEKKIALSIKWPQNGNELPIVLFFLVKGYGAFGAKTKRIGR